MTPQEAVKETLEILREAYLHFQMKKGGEFSFMVVAGMYLNPRKLTDNEIQKAKEMVSKIKNE